MAIKTLGKTYKIESIWKENVFVDVMVIEPHADSLQFYSVFGLACKYAYILKCYSNHYGLSNHGVHHAGSYI